MPVYDNDPIDPRPESVKDPIEPRPPSVTTSHNSVEIVPGKRVSKKMFLFAQYLFEFDFDHTKAVLAAGYMTKEPNKQASECMAHPAVQEYVLARLRKIQEGSEVSLSKVIQQMWSEATREGEEAQHSARVSALSNLMRALGGFDRGRGNAKRPVIIHGFEEMFSDELESPDEPEAIEDKSNANSG